VALPNVQRAAAPRTSLPRPGRLGAWWVEPVLVVTTLVLFSLYATFRALEARYSATYGLGSHYLSPFYSPPIQEWVPIRFPLSPALYVLVFPLSFRATCYFCRRSYYRAFFWDPPACAVREIAEAQRRKYTGEREFPLVFQNFHRYALYAILVFVAFHWIHFMDAFRFTDPRGTTHFGLGLGTLVLGFDTLMLSAYVFSCHSFRHLVGGVVNRFSASKARHAFWSQVTFLNGRHGLFFWLSLISVGLADLYVRLVASGQLHDIRFF